MKINYKCRENINPEEKAALDELIPDAIQNGAHLELPDVVDVEVVFNDPLNRTCIVTIRHPKKPILIEHTF